MRSQKILMALNKLYHFWSTKFPDGHNNDGFFFSPIIVYKKENLKTIVSININYDILKNKKDLGRFIIYLAELFDFEKHLPEKKNTVSQIVDVPEIDDWKNKVEKITNTINEEQKVVLSRQKVISFENKVNLSTFIDHLESSKEHYSFYLKIFKMRALLVFLPEKLFRLKESSYLLIVSQEQGREVVLKMRIKTLRKI